MFGLGRQENTSVSSNFVAEWLPQPKPVVDSRRLFQLSALIFILAFGIRLGLVVYRQDYQEYTRTDMSTVALAVLRGDGYSNAFPPVPLPTAVYPPGHPTVLMGIYSVFGQGHRGEFAKHVWACAASALQYALLPWVALQLGLPVLAGLLAGAVGAVTPLKYVTETSGEWDGPDTAILAILVTVLMASGKWTASRAAAVGAFCGFVVLFAPQLFTAMCALMLVRLFLTRTASFPQAFVWAGAFVLMITPWTIRNYRLFDSLFFIRSNFGLELAISNRDNAGIDVMTNFPPEPLAVHPQMSRREAARMRQLGETAYFREKKQQGQQWILAHPAKFAELTAKRFTYFWFHRTGALAKDAFHWIVTAAGIAGLALLWRRNRETAYLFATIWLTFPVLYYIMQASTRYRYPIDWTYLLLAGYAAVVVFTKSEASGEVAVLGVKLREPAGQIKP